MSGSLVEPYCLQYVSTLFYDGFNYSFNHSTYDLKVGKHIVMQAYVKFCIKKDK